MDALALGAPCSPATTGAAAPPASWRRCGPNVCAGLVSYNGYNIQHIAGAPSRCRPMANSACGTSTTSTASAAAPGWRPTGAHCAAAVANLVADVGLRRRHVRAQCRGLRQPRLRRRGDPLLSPPLRPVAGATRVRGDRARLAAQPPIAVPTITFDGNDDGVAAPATARARPPFTGRARAPRSPGVGHNLPQEAPQVFADAVLELVPAALSRKRRAWRHVRAGIERRRFTDGSDRKVRRH